jgi:hypothetical protein
MGIARQGALRLHPLEDGKRIARPVLDPLGSGIVDILHPMTAGMAAGTARKLRDFDVVRDDVVGGRHRIRLAGEVFRFLVIPVRSPNQDVGSIQIFSGAVAQHVLRFDPVGWVVVVQTAGGVDVLVEADVAQAARVDPALQRDFLRHRLVRSDGDRPVALFILGPAAIFDRIFARWKVNGFAIITVDLVLEEQIRHVPLGAIGVDPTQFVADREARRGRCIVLIENV